MLIITCRFMVEIPTTAKESLICTQECSLWPETGHRDEQLVLRYLDKICSLRKVIYTACL